MIFRVWDSDFYDSKSRFFAHEHEKHGRFDAKSEDDLKMQLKNKGLDPAKCRWESET